jgi:hypothetical protein
VLSKNIYSSFLYNVCNINIQPVTLDVRTGMYVGLRIKCQLFLLDFSQNLKMLTDFIKIGQYQISIQFSSCFVREDRQIFKCA